MQFGVVRHGFSPLPSAVSGFERYGFSPLPSAVSDCEVWVLCSSSCSFALPVIQERLCCNGWLIRLHFEINGQGMTTCIDCYKVVSELEDSVGDQRVTQV